MSKQIAWLRMIWHGFFFEAVPPRRLAVWRICVWVFSAGMTLAISRVILLSNRSWEGHRFQGGSLLWRVHHPWPPGTIVALAGLTTCVALCAAAGAFYRVTSVAAALGFLVLGTYYAAVRIEATHIHSANTAMVLLLALSPQSADVLSVDRLIRVRRGETAPDPAPSWRYCWPLSLAMLTIAGFYFAGGVTKLVSIGMDYMAGNTLRRHVSYWILIKERLGGPLLSFGPTISRSPLLLAIAASGTICMELLGVFVVPFRSVRRIWVLAAVFFHVSIAFTMRIVFPFYLSGMAFLPFLPLERFAKARRT